MSDSPVPPTIEWNPARFWHAQGANIVCDLCPLHCVLKDGEHGVCQVRRRCGNQMETATMSSTVWHWQSVERKPLYHFRPGLPTLTLAAPGCNMRCHYCQNAVISQYGKDPDAIWSARPINPKEVVQAAAQAAIAISYTEPTLAAELTLALAAQNKKIPLLWKSNGLISMQALNEIAPMLSAINIDLKAADEPSHRKLTGAPLAPVLAAIKAYRQQGVWVEISTPLINDVNTRPEQIHAMAEIVASLGPETPWHLLRVLPEYRMPNLQPTTPVLLETARQIGQQAGLHHVYVERALGAAGRTTHCPCCGNVVIERAVGTLMHNGLSEGKCQHCQHAIAGVWSDHD